MVILVSSVGAVTYTTAANKDNEKAVAVLKKEMDLLKQDAETKIAIAKVETMERFLMFGYTAEFERYQNKVGLLSAHLRKLSLIHI